MSGKPTKKDFAELINSVMGQKVMNEQKLDRILHDAKKANAEKGPEGLFDYLRELTNAPVSNKQVKDIVDMVKNSGGPDQALQSLKRQKLINENQANQIGKTMHKKGNRPRKGR